MSEIEEQPSATHLSEIHDPQDIPGGVQLHRPFVHNNEMRLLVLRMFVRGDTVRVIVKRLAESDIEATESQVLQMYGDHANDIKDVRKEFEKQTLEIGLARKAVRISRLSELFNDWVEKATTDIKSATLLVKIIHEIGTETETISNLTPPAPDDEWHSLMNKLQFQPPLKERATIEAQFSMNEDQQSSKSTSPSED